MSGLLHVTQNIDVAIYHFLNGFAGNRLLDYIANFEESSHLVKGGLLLAVYWYFWSRAGSDQSNRRKAIITIMVGALVALVVTRTIADIAPYRIRPMYDVHLQRNPYAFPTYANLVEWNAFPSDTATYFFALAFGLACLSRRLAVPAMLYAAGWICLPRMYLGIHYASDLIVGGAIGVVAVWVALKIEWLQSGLAAHLVAAAERRPEIFYPAAFLTSFEMGMIFDDVRLIARSLFQHTHAESSKLMHLFPAAFATLSVLTIGSYFAIRLHETRKRSLSGQSGGVHLRTEFFGALPEFLSRVPRSLR